MDYYSILGIPKTASDSDIRKAYKKQSMQHHPDRGGDEEQFKRVNEAYQTLRDPHKKAMYDHQQTAGRGGFNFNTQNMGGFEDIFAQAFGGFQQRQQPRNRDITISVGLTLEDVLQGKEVIATYRLRSGREENVSITIPKGAKDGDTIRYQGFGEDLDHRLPRGNLNVRLKVTPHHRFNRDGDSLWTKEYINALDLITGCSIIVNTLDRQEIKINVPPGTNSGTTLRVTDHGLPNIDNGRRGHLFVKVEAKIPKVTNEEQLRKLRALRNEIGN